MNRNLRVHVDLAGQTVPVGTATFHEQRGRVSTTFVYDSEYLSRADSYEIDPRLPLDSGPGTISGLPGAFHDASPDRWGKNLIRREAEQIGARGEITDVDFLMEASDISRQGALRFCTADRQPYLEEHSDVPKTVELERLLTAARRAQSDDDYPVGELLDAGSGTLGGARPKASVTDKGGRLMIAKFPSVSDEWNVIRWEQVALELSRQAGVETPESQLVSIGDQPVVLIDRFDREAQARRGYLSAHTLIGGDRADDADYLDIAEALEDYSDHSRADHEELFRRAAFSVGIHNTDDHTRNHGVIRSGTGWRLSPVFDVNPNPEPESSRSTSIAGATRSQDEAHGLTRLAQEIGLDRGRATMILNEVHHGIGDWESVARQQGLGDAEIRRFSPMFARQREVLVAAMERLGGTTRNERMTSGSAQVRQRGEQPRDPKGKFASYDAEPSAARLWPNGQ